MGRLSWVIPVGTTWNARYLYKKEAGRGFYYRRRCDKGNRRTKKEISSPAAKRLDLKMRKVINQNTSPGTCWLWALEWLCGIKTQVSTCFLRAYTLGVVQTHIKRASQTNCRGSKRG